MNELPTLPTPSRLLKRFALLAHWTLAWLVMAWVLFGAAWGALHRVIVPRIGELRPQREAAPSRRTGLTVRVESIHAHATNLLLAFEWGNICLFDAQGRQALRLPRILVSVAPRSLLRPKFDQILLDPPVLQVRRGADGCTWLAGLAVSSHTTEPDNGWLDRVFAHPESVIQDGAVVWTDARRAATPLALERHQGSAMSTERSRDGRRTVMNFKRDIQQIFLARLGMKDIVRRGEGQMEGQIACMGSPLSLDDASLFGACQVNVETGQFLKADQNNIAELLGCSACSRCHGGWRWISGTCSRRASHSTFFGATSQASRVWRELKTQRIDNKAIARGKDAAAGVVGDQLDSLKEYTS